MTVVGSAGSVALGAALLSRLGVVGQAPVRLAPLNHLFGDPDLAHGQLDRGLGEVGPVDQLLNALAADAEQVADLGGSDEVVHGGKHRYQTTGHLTSVPWSRETSHVTIGAGEPVLHPFNPRSNRHVWVPASYTPDTWPTFKPAPVGNHLYTATVSHLYRFYDADKVLLYVGVTTNPMRRWQVHRTTAWWESARFVAIEPVPPAERLQREQQAIEQGHPKFNVMRPFGRTTL